ncbi:hypothetical protein EAH87_12205 [Sphingomonas koreensis]|nr:hypothetical protein EAH87_12205 [Sphingomonas koreensis]
MGKCRLARMAKLVPSSAIALVVTISAASAQGVDQQSYHLPAETLAGSLRAVALASGRNIIAPADLVAGKTAPGLDGTFTSDAAVAALLAGSGLRARAVASGLIIESSNAPRGQDSASSDSVTNSSDIVVTGSRIRGAPIASSVITIGQQQIRDAGQATLADAVRALPQSFGGGQNPGVGNNVPDANGVNVGGATSINLRGIGGDATLTLINGHRLSYSASRQTIDVSAIPLGALDRIEIVPDGASALYGSDAVAGVANIVLKPDYDGVETGVRLGTSTDGGDFEQRYDVVAGHRWDTGGFIATYEFGRTTQIGGSDRSYTQDRPALTLFPALKNHSVTLSGHQRITGALR